MNDLLKCLHHLCPLRGGRWHPLVSVYYLTYGCDFRCPYCSDGGGRPYWSQPPETPSLKTAGRILTRLRAQTRHLILTGGEPLNHPAAGEVLRRAAALRFGSLILTTNGHRLDAFLPEVRAAATRLVVSLDTLDAGKADSWHGAGGGTFGRVIANLERAAALPGRNFDIAISSVATPLNLADLYEVQAYARSRGFLYAAAPQLAGVKAAEGLVGNAEYRRFFDHLIREKQDGARIFGTVLYLEHMRDLRKFRCRPFTMLTVAPGGEVHYPCLEIGHRCGSLLAGTSLHALRTRGERMFGPPPECGTRCHSACALSFALLFSRPGSLIRELAPGVTRVLCRAGLRRGHSPRTWGPGARPPSGSGGSTS